MVSQGANTCRNKHSMYFHLWTLKTLCMSYYRPDRTPVNFKDTYELYSVQCSECLWITFQVPLLRISLAWRRNLRTLQLGWSRVKSDCSASWTNIEGRFCSISSDTTLIFIRMTAFLIYRVIFFCFNDSDL